MHLYSRMLVCAVAIAWMVQSSASAALFEVGAGKTYSSIQDAVNAAAAADVAASGNNSPNPDPVDIVIDSGTYNEGVVIPADATVAFNGLNDGWTIRAAPGAKVLVQGFISTGVDRDHLTFDGINIEVENPNIGPGAGATGMFFDQTSRNNTIKNAIIYDRNPDNTNGTFAGIFFFRAFGGSTVDHVTLYNNGIGILGDQSANAVVRNTIIADSTLEASGIFSGNPNSFSFSNLWNPNASAGDCVPSPGAACTDAGNNIGSGTTWPVGADPMFTSIDPADPFFLYLDPGSPSDNTGDGVNLGEFMNMTHNNMGARPTIPEPASLALIGFGVAMMLRRRA